jgi:peptidoglycan/xylan/chitin deacetylase (PgdA/CDA1 family)
MQPAFGAGSCGPGALGVSRVAAIDATGGPRYGHLQYRDHDFLKKGEVVLTFDDGPLRRHTRRVLDALAAHCTRGTFFLVGRMAVSDPTTAKEIAAKGHTIATHTWSHKNIRALSAGSAEKEMELGISAIQMAIGKPIAPFFRFPYLADSKSALEALQKRNIAVFSIDIDARDYKTGSASQVRHNIMSQLASKGKGIILFHDIQGSTANAISDVLSDLKAKNYRIVHIVAKQPTTTVASYDEAASRLLAGKPSGLAMASASTRRSGVVAPVKPVYTVDEPRKPEVSEVGTQPAPRSQPSPDWRLSVFNSD